MPRPRILLDITTLLRATGHADGITRTLWHLTNYALNHLPEIEFVFLAPKPWSVEKTWVARHLAGTHRIDISYFADTAAKPRFRERLPLSLKSLILWMQRPRRQALLLADRIVLEGAQFSALADSFRSRLINERYRRTLASPDGTIARLVSHRLAMRPGPAVTRDDIVILAGSDWMGMVNALPADAQRPRTAALCYDAIPLLFPHYFTPAFVANFRRCVMDVYAAADILIFSADKIRQDTERLCGRKLACTKIIRLGADAGRAKLSQPELLPPELVTGRFALFVSTLEPRKGHRTLFEVWKALLDEGVPQDHDFKLVFVGRKGWMVDELVAELRAHPSFGTSLLWLDDVSDETLTTLYDACSFTLYPSLYEGFGLPIIESFQHGKPVISSSAGALDETVNGLSPTLDPNAPDEWLAVLRRWITDPEESAKYARVLRAQFRTRSWLDTAGEFFSVVLAALQPSTTLTPIESRTPK